MQQRAAGWNQTCNCCSKDIAFATGCLLLPTELLGAPFNVFFNSLSVLIYTVKETKICGDNNDMVLLIQYVEGGKESICSSGSFPYSLCRDV